MVNNYLNYHTIAIAMLVGSCTVLYPKESDSIGQQVLYYTSQFRKEQGLPELIWHQGLANCAQQHSYAMGIYEVEFGHEGFKQRIKNLPFRVISAAENVFMTNQRGDLPWIAVNAWINSPGHVRNIVGNYTHCGIGIYLNADGFWYFTQIFVVLKG